jgi:hypothetical protein
LECGGIPLLLTENIECPLRAFALQLLNHPLQPLEMPTHKAPRERGALHDASRPPDPAASSHGIPPQNSPLRLTFASRPVSLIVVMDHRITLAKRLCLLLTFILAAQTLPAQTTDDPPDSALVTNEVSYSPLYLFTNGPGWIFPFEDGQMLEVGRTYRMLAIPDRDNEFTNWQPVNLFTFTEILHHFPGDDGYIVTSTLASPLPEYYSDPVLEFTNQPEEVILDTPARTITKSLGWQANFVAVTNCDFRRDWHFPREDNFPGDRRQRSER